MLQYRTNRYRVPIYLLRLGELPRGVRSLVAWDSRASRVRGAAEQGSHVSVDICHFSHPDLGPASSSVWREDPGLLSRPCIRKEGSSLARESGSGWALGHCIAPVLVVKDNKCEAT